MKGRLGSGNGIAMQLLVISTKRAKHTVPPHYLLAVSSLRTLEMLRWRTQAARIQVSMIADTCGDQSSTCTHGSTV